MRKTLFLVAAASALCAALPAAAQYGGTNANFDARIDQLQLRLDAGIRAGTINRREAWPLRQKLVALDRLERRYSYGGFSLAERSDLWQRIRALRQDIRIADNRSWDRHERFAYDDDRYTGRGGPLEDVCVDRRGVGGLIDNVLGRDCLQIGDPARGNLAPVPYAYRGRYRDGGGVYFRSDGRTVYEIDARTNRVVDIHIMPD